MARLATRERRCGCCGRPLEHGPQPGITQGAGRAPVRRLSAGETVGRLLILSVTERLHGHRAARCQCACSVIKNIRVDALLDGRTVSCGCWGAATLHWPRGNQYQTREEMMRGEADDDQSVLDTVHEGRRGSDFVEMW
jgi:hypothetical protein